MSVSKKLQASLLRGSAVLLTLAAPVHAHAETSEIELGILQILVDEGVIPYEKAQSLLDKAREKERLEQEAEAAEQAEGTVDVPYMPDVIRLQIKEDVKSEVIATAKEEGWMAPETMPDWAKKLTISGDFRARYQSEDFPEEGNFPFFPDVAEINRLGGVTDADGFPLLNSTVDRLRPNYRARIKLEAEINDNLTFGFRVASGDDSSPVSTNSTFGEYFYKESLWIDQAYVDFKLRDGLHFVGGRMPNPFYSTDLVWDSDINPEGGALLGEYGFSEAFGLFGTVAALPLQERSLYDDSFLYAAQAGTEGALGSALKYKAALSYYLFDNIQSLKNPDDGSRINDWSAPKYLANGNSVFNMRTDGLTTLAGLASEFELAAFTGRVSYDIGEYQLGLTGEVVENQAMDADEIAELRGEEGVEPGNLGWQVGLDAGHREITGFGDWKVSASYRYLETDAVLDIFTDSDFGLGGTDLEGYILEADYGIYENTSLGLAYLSSDSINRAPFSLDIIQLDLNVRF